MKAFIRKSRLASAAALSLLLVMGAFAVHPACASSSETTLQSVQVEQLHHGQVRVALHLSATAPKPLSFTMDNPARIVIDLPHTNLGLASDQMTVKRGGVESIMAAATRDRSRLVLTLDKMVAYRLQRQNNEIFLTLGTDNTQARDVAAVTMANAVAARAGLSPPWQINSIRFRRSAGGAGRILVRLSDSHIPVNLHQVGNQVIVDFSNTAVPTHLLKRYDASDFGTPVADFSLTRTAHGSRMTIDGTGAYTELAYQANTEYVVELRPVGQGQARPRHPKYTGQRLRRGRGQAQCDPHLTVMQLQHLNGLQCRRAARRAGGLDRKCPHDEQ